MDVPVDFGAFGAMFTVFIVLFIAAVIFIIVTIVRNVGAARRNGYDPMTMQTDIASKFGRAMDAQVPKSTEERLAELEELRRSNKITAAEYDDARSRILGSL